MSRFCVVVLLMCLKHLKEKEKQQLTQIAEELMKELRNTE